MHRLRRQVVRRAADVTVDHKAGQGHAMPIGAQRRRQLAGRGPGRCGAELGVVRGRFALVLLLGLAFAPALLGELLLGARPPLLAAGIGAVAVCLRVLRAALPVALLALLGAGVLERPGDAVAAEPELESAIDELDSRIAELRGRLEEADGELRALVQRDQLAQRARPSTAAGVRPWANRWVPRGAPGRRPGRTQPFARRCRPCGRASVSWRRRSVLT